MPQPLITILFPYTTLFRSERINGFVKSVLGEKTARVEIPAERDDVYVVINEKTLPLASLGTGIHELVILSDRKSTRLNSSHTVISYAVFCLKKKTINVFNC